MAHIVGAHEQGPYNTYPDIEDGEFLPSCCQNSHPIQKSAGRESTSSTGARANRHIATHANALNSKP